MVQKLKKIFISGLMSFLPFAAAVYITISVVNLFENILGNTLKTLLPFYFPGLGFIFTIILIFTFGIMMNSLITESLFRSLEAMLLEVPFFRTVYSPLRDLMNLFKNTSQSKMQSVVLVQLSDSGPQMLGIVTREQVSEALPEGTNLQNKIAVYIPLSYSMGGFTILVEKNRLNPVPISVERAMGLILTGWIAADQKIDPKSLNKIDPINKGVQNE